MKIEHASIADVLVLEPKTFGDARGFFYESYNRKSFARDTGIDLEFVQDNHSSSSKNVLRGLHYQLRQPQGKLVRVTAGEIWDVAVDLRRSSASFGRWTGLRLDAGSKRMRHHVVGEIELNYQSIELPGEPGLRLSVFTAEPDTPNQQALRFLASWTATATPPAANAETASDDSRQP